MIEAKDTRRRGGTLVACFIAVLALVALSDTEIARTAATSPRGFYDAGVLLSRFGLSGYMLAISAALVIAAGLAQRKRRARLVGGPPRLLAEGAAYFFVTVAWSGILCQIIKHVVGRARPKLFEQFGAFHFDPLIFRHGTDSFPSGHATTVFAVAMMFSLFVPAGRGVFFLLALTVGIARILAGAHYPSDVVAGAALGSLTALWTARVFAARNIAFDTAALPRLVLKREAPSRAAAVRVAS